MVRQIVTRVFCKRLPICRPHFRKEDISMLRIFTRLADIQFDKLMEVYREGNEEKAQEPGGCLWQAEQDFYDYLAQAFFAAPGAAYAVWEENGAYRSALRLEPYENGLLLEALETAPEQRRRGYAKQLIMSVLEYLHTQGEIRPVYSHVHKANKPSLYTHYTCGFQVHTDYARYLDGSVRSNMFTLVTYPGRNS